MDQGRTKQPKLKKADQLASVATSVKFHLPNDLLKRADADLTDLTGCERTGAPYWDPNEPDVLVIPMDREPSAAQQDKIRRRLVTTDATDEANLYALLSAANDPTAPTWARALINVELAKYGETEAT